MANETKHTSSFTNESPSSQHSGFDFIGFDTGAFDGSASDFSNETKHSASQTNETKH